MKTVTIALIAALAFAGGIVPAAAQEAGDPIAECRAAHGANAQARIACLESAIARMQGRVQEAEQETVQAQQQAAQAQQQAALAQQQAEQAQQQAAASEPRRPRWSLPGFRAEQEAQIEAEREEVRVTIVRARYSRDGLGIFTTDDGKVWRETVAAPERRHLESNRTYEGAIHRGIFGYRLNLDGIRWEYKVEPLN